MEENLKKEEGITFSDILRVLWKNIILIGLITAVITIIGAVYTFVIVKPTYKASADIIVAVESGSTVDTTGTLRITETVAQTVTTDIVAKQVAENNELSKYTVIGNTSTSSSTTSYIVTITYVDTDKERCVKVVNELADQTIDVFTNDNTLKKYKASLTQVTTPEKASYNSPNKKLYIIISVIGGLVLACIVVFFKEFMSNKFKTKEEVERVSGLNIIGLMPDNKENEKNNVVQFPTNVQQFEPYNKLISSIEYYNMGKSYKSLMFTSSLTNELKSTTVANTAYTLVHNEKKVCIVDLDTRKPRIHRIFKISKKEGIVDYFKGELKLEDIIKTTEQGIDIITAGSDIVNPIVLLKNEKLPELINELKEKYDYVLIDTPPVAGLTDAVLISQYSDAVVFNVAMNQVKKKQAKESIKTLQNAKANILGVNITKAQLSKSEYYSYYYYYGTPDDSNASPEDSVESPDFHDDSETLNKDSNISNE